MALLNILAQTIAALLIFVVGYLALLFSALAGLVLALLLYKASRLLWRYASAHAASRALFFARIAEPVPAAPRKVGLLAGHAEAARTPSL